jgi:small subunit ribosomal protein S6
MMRTYELTYITKPDLDDRTLNALIERVNAMVAADGGSIIKVDRWGLRPLSYPIRKYREGHYVFTLLALPAAAPARLEQRLRLTEDIIRHLLVRADEVNDASAPLSFSEEVAASRLEAPPAAEDIPADEPSAA